MGVTETAAVGVAETAAVDNSRLSTVTDYLTDSVSSGSSGSVEGSAPVAADDVSAAAGGSLTAVADTADTSTADADTADTTGEGTADAGAVVAESATTSAADEVTSAADTADAGEALTVHAETADTADAESSLTAHTDAAEAGTATATSTADEKLTAHADAVDTGSAAVGGEGGGARGGAGTVLTDAGGPTVPAPSHEPNPAGGTDGRRPFPTQTTGERVPDPGPLAPIPDPAPGPDVPKPDPEPTPVPDPTPMPKPDPQPQPQPQPQPAPGPDPEPRPLPDPAPAPQPQPAPAAEPLAEDAVATAKPLTEDVVAAAESLAEDAVATAEPLTENVVAADAPLTEGAVADDAPLASLREAARAALAKQGIAGERAAVYLVLDRSGSMRNYYKDGTVQHLAEQVLGLSAELGEEAGDAVVSVVFFSTDVDGTAEISLDSYADRVTELHAGLGHMGRTNYHWAIDAVVQHYEKAAAQDGPDRPALVIFQTDGAPTSKAAAEKALCDAARLPIFWQFVGFGDPEAKGFDFLRKLDDLAVPEKRAVDNAGFFHAGADPRSLPDADLYRELMIEFPEWLTEARAAGILGR
ncbi:VWA domain-containing protein [Streptomyces sp. NPDC050617]|uniref:VWA domain-containing protein n=1 Tax=Streptomyces sp. NPDC050617 TaxID=3154628 RepID=UPI003449A198